MAVCRFFQQGNCRYGDNCWNEHPSGGNQGFSMTAQRQLFGGNRGGGGQKVSFRDSANQNGSSYRWVSQDAQQQQQQQQQGSRTAATNQQMSSSDIVKGLATEVATTWEGGKMWPFSCLGFEKDLPSLPGFMDISAEEMRFDAYEALKDGNIQPYVQKVEAAFNQLTTQRQELKNPNLTLKQKLISFIDDCRRKKTSGQFTSSKKDVEKIKKRLANLKPRYSTKIATVDSDGRELQASFVSPAEQAGCSSIMDTSKLVLGTEKPKKSIPCNGKLQRAQLENTIQDTQLIALQRDVLYEQKEAATAQKLCYSTMNLYYQLKIQSEFGLSVTDEQ